MSSLATTSEAEEEGGAFQVVRSKRRLKPTRTNKSYSNSNGDLTGPSSTGFVYASTSTSRSNTVKEERGEKAHRSVETLVRYLGSQLRCAKGKQREREGRGTYAQHIAQCLGDVWSDNGDSTSDGGAVNEAKEHSIKPPVPRRIVCLGLGSPVTSRSAQIQLALMVVVRSYLLLLQDEVEVDSKASDEETKVDQTAAAEDAVRDGRTSDQETKVDSTRGVEDASPDSKVSIRRTDADSRGNAIECVAYDPIFTSSDTALLARWGVRSATSPTLPLPNGTDNTAASKATHEEGDTIESLYTNITTPTLLYMPHCDRELYERVLSLNYPSPPDDSRPLVLLSNILSNYTTYTTSLDQDFPTLARLIPSFEVRELPNWEAGKKSAPLPREDEADDEVKAAEFAKLWDRNALRDLGFHWF